LCLIPPLSLLIDIPPLSLLIDLLLAPDEVKSQGRITQDSGRHVRIEVVAD